METTAFSLYGVVKAHVNLHFNSASVLKIKLLQRAHLSCELISSLEFCVFLHWVRTIVSFLPRVQEKSAGTHILHTHLLKYRSFDHFKTNLGSDRDVAIKRDFTLIINPTVGNIFRFLVNCRFNFLLVLIWLRINHSTFGFFVFLGFIMNFRLHWLWLKDLSFSPVDNFLFYNFGFSLRSGLFLIFSFTFILALLCGLGLLLGMGVFTCLLDSLLLSLIILLLWVADSSDHLAWTNSVCHLAANRVCVVVVAIVVACVARTLSWRTISIVFSWISWGSDLTMVCILLVVHLGALTTLVWAVASNGLFVAGLDVAHCEEQVSHRHEIQLLKGAIRVLQVDKINICISLVV